MNDNFVKVDNKQAEILYNSKIVVCDGGYIKGKRYNKTFSKVKKGFELDNLDPNLTFIKNGRLSYDQSDYKEISKRSLSRTRDTLIGYVSANKDIWKSFLTLTFSDNVTDINEANKCFRTFISNTKRAFPDFKYIGVPEYQKRGAVHYHILTNLECGNQIPKRPIKKTYNIEKKKWFEIEFYDIPRWGYGFSTAFPLDMTDDNFNVALYLTKYLYKDIDNRLFGHNKILKSNGLNSPTVFYLANNKTYEQALNYIVEKGYDMKNYHYSPDKAFEPEMDINECHMISKSDIQVLKMFLSANYNEQGNKAFRVSVRKCETLGEDMPFYW